MFYGVVNKWSLDGGEQQCFLFHQKRNRTSSNALVGGGCIYLMHLSGSDQNVNVGSFQVVRGDRSMQDQHWLVRPNAPQRNFKCQVLQSWVCTYWIQLFQFSIALLGCFNSNLEWISVQNTSSFPLPLLTQSSFLIFTRDWNLCLIYSRVCIFVVLL